MRPLKAFFPRFVAVASLVGLWVGLASAPGCQGPDEFFRFTTDAGSPGTGGSSATGAGGTTGVAGTTGTGGTASGTAGSTTGAGGSGRGGATGAAGSATGAGGSVGAGGSAGPAGGGGSGGATGRGGTAGSTTGTGGSTTGAAGATGAGGAAGGGGSATGAAGSAGGATGTGGRAGTTGAAGSAGGSGGATGAAGTTGGATGTGGRGGATSAAGAGGSASGGAGGGSAGRIQVVAKCQPADGAQDIRVTFKVLNPESVAKQWSDIKVRYYFTPTMPITPMVKFDFVQKFPVAMLTATATGTYVEVGFAAGAGSVQGFDNVTGSDEIQLHLFDYAVTSWNSSEADDYSYRSCAGGANTSAYTDRTTMTGYYQGQLAWGTEPPL